MIINARRKVTRNLPFFTGKKAALDFNLLAVVELEQ